MDPAVAQAISTIAGALAVLILAIASRIRGGRGPRDEDDDPDLDDPPPRRRRK